MLMKGTAKELSWAVHACMMVQRPICLQLWNRSPSWQVPLLNLQQIKVKVS